MGPTATMAGDRTAISTAIRSAGSATALDIRTTADTGARGISTATARLWWSCLVVRLVASRADVRFTDRGIRGAVPRDRRVRVVAAATRDRDGQRAVVARAVAARRAVHRRVAPPAVRRAAVNRRHARRSHAAAGCKLAPAGPVRHDVPGATIDRSPQRAGESSPARCDCPRYRPCSHLRE